MKCNDGNNVKRRDVKIHSSVCPREPISCSDCNANMPRHLLEQHGVRCPKRKTVCGIGCGKVGAYDEITGAHVNECPEKVVGCLRKCGLEESNQIKQKDLKDHAEKCPLEPVSCPFDNVGCKPELVRRELQNHMQSDLQHHMEVFIAAYNKLDAEHSEVKSELAKIKEAQHEMKESLDIMTKSISYGLSLIELPRDKGAHISEGMDYIRSALDPKVNKDNNLTICIPKFQEKWFSQPFYVLDTYKMCLIFENLDSTNQETYQAMTVSLCLMTEEYNTAEN